MHLAASRAIRQHFRRLYYSWPSVDAVTVCEGGEVCEPFRNLSFSAQRKSPEYS